MRAKNEFKFLADAYNTKLILERVVDGTLMCPEACCGAPVMECKCGPDCPHCNCHEIQKLAGKDKTIKEFYKMRDPDGDGSWPDDEKEEEREKDPNYGEPAEDAEAEDIFPNSEYGRHLRREAERHEQEDKEAKALEREWDEINDPLPGSLGPKVTPTHKPYVTSYTSNDNKKVFDVLDSNGQPVFRTHNKREAYKWFKMNYENI